MNAVTWIYTAVALSASLSLGTLVAFFWSERRWREREREQRLKSVRMSSTGQSNASGANGTEPKSPPIQRRSFHEALREDAPELAPSPQARAIFQQLAARQRNAAHVETENHEMKLTHLAAAASLGLAACAQSPTSATPPARTEARMSQPDYVAPRPEVTWAFDGHSFGAYCYNTIGCRVLYDDFYHVKDDENEVAPPPKSDVIQKHWNGGYIVMSNFPPPAVFTTASPCELCSKKAYQLGIKDIVYIDPYPGISIPHVISTGDREARPGVRLFSGAVGKAYHRVYEPMLPVKDELMARLS